MIRKIDRAVDSYAAANWLGFKVPPERPSKDEKPEKKEKALRGLRTFFQARANGRAPQPDGYNGRKPWWYESTLERFLKEREQQKSTRGRKALSKAVA